MGARVGRAHAAAVLKRGAACFVFLYLGAWGHEAFSKSLFVTTEHISVVNGVVIDNWTLKGTCSGYTKKEFVGVALVTFAWPLSFVAGTSFSVGASKLESVPEAAKIAVFLALAVGCILAAARAYADAHDILRCGVVWCYRLENPDSPNSYKVVVSAMVFFGALSGACLELWLALVACREMLRRERRQEDQYVAMTVHTTTRGGVRTATASTLAALACLLLLTASLPDSWEDMNASGIKAWAASRRHDSLAEGSPRKNVVFRTIYAAASDRFVFKFFPDQLLYYGFLALLVLITAATQLVPALGRLARTRVAVAGPFSISFGYKNRRADAWSVGGSSASIGECVFLGLFALFIGLEARYWFYDHRFDGSDERQSDAEIVARGLGQLANCCLGLLLLPVSKHSILSQAFAWDRALWFHIWLGYSTLALFVGHAVAWWHVYSQQHLFPEDVLRVPMRYPTNGSTAKDRCGDNFTIPLATLVVATTLLLVGVLAHFQVRRAHFETFYVSHHVFVALYATALWHAASSWYYVLGGILQYAFDHTLRTVNASRRRQLSCRPGPYETTRLDVAGAFPYAPGQYAFLNLPHLSPLEWHPFTLSSAPTDAARTDRLTFDVKVSGDFTKRLRDAAALQTLVALDGPHGTPFDATDTGAVLLVAGGIGITPCHAIVNELRHSSFPGAVTLLWVAKTPAAFDLFTFADLPQENFRVNLYVTQRDHHDDDDHHLGSGRADSEAPPPYELGRPDIPAVVDAFVLASHHLRNPKIFACGPKPLVDAASSAALRHNLHFDADIFEF